MIRSLRISFFLLIAPVICLGQTNAAIGERTYHFKDTARNRPLVTEVWYPTADHYQKADTPAFMPFVQQVTIRNAHLPHGRHPLIMVSHGTGGNRLSLTWLTDALVKQGYIVAAVDHWGNTSDNKIPIDFVTPWERPQDISYVLTSLLKDAELGKLIDRERIGAAGFSIGGYTVLALAGAELNLDALIKFSTTSEGKKETNIPELPGMMQMIKPEDVKASFAKAPPLKDNRIKAFVVISPAIGQGFANSSQLKVDGRKLLIIAPQSDSIAPIKTNALHYHALIPGSQIVIIKGPVNHYVFLNEAADVAKKEAPVYFTDLPGVDRHLIHQDVAAQAAAFFNKRLK